MKIYLRADEVICTVMLNLIAVSMVGYFLRCFDLSDDIAQGVCSRQIAQCFRLSTIWDVDKMAVVTPVVPVLFGIAAIGHGLLWWTRPGLYLRAQGENPIAARSVGINQRRILALAMLSGGGFAGIAGTNQLLGHYRFSVDEVAGIGFMGIVVAVLGGQRLPGIVVASILVAGWRLLEIDLQRLSGAQDLSMVGLGALVLGYLALRKKERFSL
jgi:simple sugar transport system permease protein